VSGAAGSAGVSGAAGADAGDVDAGPPSLTLATFDAARGGDMAGKVGVPFAPTRTVLEAEFALTWDELGSLTDLATSNAEGVLLAPAYGDTTGVAPLSSAEQTALRDFVEAGGFAVLLTENDTSFDATSDSFLAPFGVSATGTLQGDATGIASGGHPIASGWTTVPLSWPGSCSTPDAGAAIVATTSLGPYVMVFESGALASGSGTVVIITDASPYFAGWTGANSTESLTILTNALHHASGK
jgi:hypothetical protein